MSNSHKKIASDTSFVLNFFNKLLSGLDDNLSESEDITIKNEKDPKELNIKEYNNPAETAIEYVNKYSKMPAQHCWDWVEKIYNIAGFDRKTIFHATYPGRIAGNHRAGPELLKQIQPGDWLFLNNRNKDDLHGNHSAIFLNWKSSNIAEIASYYNGASHIHTYDINKFPITAIMKPVPKK